MGELRVSVRPWGLNQPQPVTGLLGGGWGEAFSHQRAPGLEAHPDTGARVQGLFLSSKSQGLWSETVSKFFW